MITKYIGEDDVVKFINAGKNQMRRK